MAPAAVAMDAREGAPRQGLLAVALQEVLTAIGRVRANRQSVTDAATFRNHVKQLLAGAHEEARRTGYASDEVKLAIYAIVVFLDESILNSPLPALAGWSRKPLQEELFGEHMGGEVFFENLRTLIGRQDSEELADVLEVYQLCLLLGFRGRHGAAGQSEVQRWAGAAAEKIARIRGAPGELVPGWAPPERETFPTQRDPWIRRLALAALGLASAAIVIWVVLRITLGSWISQLQSLQPGP
jgi:type VI secretion system protein ImpK